MQRSAAWQPAARAAALALALAPTPMTLEVARQGDAVVLSVGLPEELPDALAERLSGRGLFNEALAEYRLALGVVVGGLVLTTAFAAALGMPAGTGLIYMLLYLVINAAINPLTALLRVPNGELLERSTAHDLLQAAAQEAAAVAAAQLVVDTQPGTWCFQQHARPAVVG